MNSLLPTITEGLELVVTATDMQKARASKNCQCPIACAFERVFGLTALVSYDNEWTADGARKLLLVAQVERRRWVLPQIAVDAARRHDQGIPLKPFSFPLPKEEPSGTS